MAGAAAVSADARNARDAGAMGLVGVRQTASGTNRRTATDAGIGTPARDGIPRRRPRPGRRIPAEYRDRNRYCRPYGARACLGRRHQGPLKDIHRRVATAIFFESSGGQRERIAHLPELRFALGGPSVDTTSIDSAALNLEATAFFIRKVSNDGFRIHHQPTLKKVVNDRKASLDFEKDVRPLMQKIVREQFQKDTPIRIEPFPTASADIDRKSTRLNSSHLVISYA